MAVTMAAMMVVMMVAMMAVKLMIKSSRSNYDYLATSSIETAICTTMKSEIPTLTLIVML